MGDEIGGTKQEHEGEIGEAHAVEPANSVRTHSQGIIVVHSFRASARVKIKDKCSRDKMEK